MLGFIEKVNANFYPIPLKEPQEISPGGKHFDRIETGYLTKSDFEALYDGCAEVLHCRNPYAPGDPTINITHPVEEWLRRIKTLLAWHFVQLVDTPGLWVIKVPNDGPVQAVLAMADGPFVVGSPS
jgi:hypothetical protein